MMSSSPHNAGPDWRSFPQPETAKTGSDTNNLALPPASSPSRPSQQQQQQPASRTWTLNDLGGEALSARSGVQRRNSNLTDPIGSRPGSRTDAVATSNAAENGAPGSSFRRVSQRPSASAAAGVIAAASSAAARSRATSPAMSGSEGLHAASSLRGQNQQPLRMEHSSSPAFVNTRSQWNGLSSSGTGHDVFGGMGDSESYFGIGESQAMAGTPKLVVDEPESNEHRRATPSILDGLAENLAATSPVGDATAAFASLMGRANLGASNGYGDASRDHVHTVAPHAQRYDAGNFASADPSIGAFGISLQQPNEGLSASASSTSHPGTLLSPSAISAGVFPSSLSSQAGPSGTGTSFNGGGGTLAGQHFPGTFQPQQAHHHLNDRAGVSSPSQESMTRSAQRSLSHASPEFEAELLAARTTQETIERLGRVEIALRDVTRSITGLNRNVSILLDRTRQLSPNAYQQPPRSATSTQGGAGVAQLPSDEVRALNAQVAMLSATVSQLLGQAGGNGGTGGHASLAGLGLAGGTPILGTLNGGSTSNLNTPQLGTLPGTPAYINGSRFASMQQQVNMGSTGNQPMLGGGGGTAPPNDRNSRLSPRPGASPGPHSRRWSSMRPGTPEVSQSQNAGTLGAMNPPDAGIVVTKWEHLNLHNDLLRSILKYGLGPPNKIQQRALPFLLRGSDIIAQAPPTQERIASYVIPVLQLVLNILRGEAALPAYMGVRGPMALIISTTVDQATQAQRMAMGLGAALGIRVHTAAASSLDVAQEASALIQTQPQIVVGTPHKMMDLFNFLANNTKGAISLDDIRVVVLDEADQMIARNLSDHISTLLRILPTPRVVQYTNPGAAMAAQRAGVTPLPQPRSPGFAGNGPLDTAATVNGDFAVTTSTTDRQTAIFSNTVPQDVLNFAQSIHLRESVRVLVRREGGATAGSVGLGSGNQGGTVASHGNSATHQQQQQQHNSTNGTIAAYAAGSSNPAGQPNNALGASPANNHANPLSDPMLAPLRGLRQYYLYVAVTTGSGGGAHSPNPASHHSQMTHAIEMKLDVITDLLEDIDFGQAVVYVSSTAAHEAVTYKLASKGIEALGLHRDMASTTRQQVLAKYRSATTGSSYLHAAGQNVVGAVGGSGSGAGGASGGTSKKALVVHDVLVHPKDVHQVPLIVFYDLPRSVDEYKEKIACAASGGPSSRPSVCVNVVTGSGGPRGDIEMLRTLECHLGCKMAELPMNPSQIMHF